MTEQTSDPEVRLHAATAEWTAAVNSMPVNGLHAWYERLAKAHTGMAQAYEAFDLDRCSPAREVAINGYVSYHYSAARRAQRSAVALAASKLEAA